MWAKKWAKMRPMLPQSLYVCFKYFMFAKVAKQTICIGLAHSQYVLQEREVNKYTTQRRCEWKLSEVEEEKHDMCGDYFMHKSSQKQIGGYGKLISVMERSWDELANLLPFYSGWIKFSKSSYSNPNWGFLTWPWHRLVWKLRTFLAFQIRSQLLFPHYHHHSSQSSWFSSNSKRLFSQTCAYLASMRVPRSFLVVPPKTFALFCLSEAHALHSCLLYKRLACDIISLAVGLNSPPLL